LPEAVEDSPLGRSPVRRFKPEHRSRVSNNADLLPDIDGRSALARRYRDIANAIIIDMGGLDACSESRLQLIRRFSAAACIAEKMEAALVRGEQIDVAEHGLLCSTLVRIAQRIGINRVPKTIVPSLHDYLETAASEPVEGGDAGP
jgi:hypothetical protein